MKLNLPVAALRSFVAIATEGSMVGAAARVFLTQSALSLQIKRLEDLLQVSLFDRQGRTLILTEPGRLLLGHAQALLQHNDSAVAALDPSQVVGPMRIGVVQDFADTLLSETLAGFARQNPAAQVQVRVAGSRDLRGMMASDRLDLALYLSHDAGPAVLCDLAMCWFGDATLASHDPLPLAMLDEPCLFRAAALRALEAAGRPYRIVMETESLSALQAAVVGGMALTCRTRMGLGDEAPSLAQADLPALPHVSLMFEARTPVREPVRYLRTLIRAALTDALGDARAQACPVGGPSLSSERPPPLRPTAR